MAGVRCRPFPDIRLAVEIEPSATPEFQNGSYAISGISCLATSIYKYHFFCEADGRLPLFGWSCFGTPPLA